MNFDRRIFGAFSKLGYDMFPFDAFDEDGQVKALDDKDIPAHYKEAVGRIATAPVWLEIYKAVAQLGTHDEKCFMVGLRFLGDSIAVAIFKALNSVPNAQTAHSWSVNYMGTIVQTISDYAGRSHIVDPEWVKILGEVIPLLPTQQQPSKPDPTAPKPDPTTNPFSAAQGREFDAAIGVPASALLALKVLNSVLTNWTVRTKVLTTTWWYTPSGMPDWTGEQAGQWKPLQTEYTEWRKRTVHGLWNAGPPSAAAYRIYSGSKIHWQGGSVWDMPHLPWQWCAAFYPTLDCKGASPSQDRSLAGLAEDTPADAVL